MIQTPTGSLLHVYLIECPQKALFWFEITTALVLAIECHSYGQSWCLCPNQQPGSYLDRSSALPLMQLKTTQG